jgi:hypothetical protein
MSARIDIQQGVYDSSEISNRTNKPSNQADIRRIDNALAAQDNQTGSITTLKQGNVLNSYRSSTYNFTLSALENAQVNDPEIYRSSELKYVILKSGGKGYTGIFPQQPTAQQVSSVDNPVYDKYDARIKQSNIKLPSLEKFFTKYLGSHFGNS